MSDLSSQCRAKRGDLFVYLMRVSSGRRDGRTINVWRIGRVASITRDGIVKAGARCDQYTGKMLPIYSVPSFDGCYIASKNIFDRPVDDVLRAVPEEHDDF